MAITLDQGPTGVRFSNEDLVYVLSSDNTGLNLILRATIFYDKSDLAGLSNGASATSVATVTLTKNPSGKFMLNLKHFLTGEEGEHLLGDGTHEIWSEGTGNFTHSHDLKGRYWVYFYEQSDDGIGANYSANASNSTILFILPGQIPSYADYLHSTSCFNFNSTGVQRGWLTARFDFRDGDMTGGNAKVGQIQMLVPCDIEGWCMAFLGYNLAGSTLTSLATKMDVRTKTDILTSTNSYDITTTQGTGNDYNQSAGTFVAEEWLPYFIFKPNRRKGSGTWISELVRPLNASNAQVGRSVQILNGQYHIGHKEYAWLIFINSYGGTDCLYFEGYKKWEVETEGKPYRKPRGNYSGSSFDYKSYTPSRGRFGVTKEEKMTLYSVHMTDQDVRCVSDIMVSKRIFMKLDGEDYFRSVVMDTTSISIERDINSKVNLVELTVKVDDNRTY